METKHMQEKRVLVIDDLSVIRGFVKSALRDLKVVMQEASDGSHALEIQESLPAQVIICDISMPGMNGEEFLGKLRERGDQTPVIMLTADGDKEVVTRLVELGIQGYLLKPFKPGVLSDRVKELLDGCAPPPPKMATDEGEPQATAEVAPVVEAASAEEAATDEDANDASDAAADTTDAADREADAA